ncbi:MAG: tRNA pseudouridine(55) synthase TruB [Clostridia bacterium]|nr:tRNA pseudouridine(55) synthase TruB [Clostridia bacterium]
MQGLLIINKPAGLTSFGVVARIKRLAGTKRVGHTGTLDPMATGVLPIFIGKATALSSFLLEADKGYTATFLFGTVTDTDDITGSVLSKTEPNITEQQIIDAFKGFVGTIEQVPPTYSAIKKQGVPMYKLARQGKEVKIEPRQVTIHSITPVTNYCNNEITVDIVCSKGTYIRSLCRDLGQKLGVGATLKDLRRNFTSGFSLEDSVDLENLTPENIEKNLLSEEKAVEYLTKVTVTEKQAKRFCNGGALDISRLKFTPNTNGQMVRVCFDNMLLGIGVVNLENNEIKIKCVTGSDYIG